MLGREICLIGRIRQIRQILPGGKCSRPSSPHSALGKFREGWQLATVHLSRRFHSRSILAWAGIFLALASALFAADETAVPPPAPENEIRITFLPPPVENGVVTLGIFDQEEKLVRMLHKEATEKEFVLGLNGFITKWDGKDQDGKLLPPAKYKVRGYMVGDLEVEGIAYHGNDWVSDDTSALYSKITALKMDGLEIKATFAKLGGGEEDKMLRVEELPHPSDLQKEPVTAEIQDGKLVIKHGTETATTELEEGDKIVASSVGFADLVWAIVETKKGREVRAYSSKAEFLRRLSYEADEPQPQLILASRMSEQIFVVEENAAEQRYRSLVLESVEKEGDAKKPATSNWKVVEQKRIIFCETFEKVEKELKNDLDFTAEETAKIETLPNPLFQDATNKAIFTIKHDAGGTFFQTPDGLPIVHITDTPRVAWSAMSQAKEGITVFQSNGAVVEQFLVKNPGNLMAFDAGEYEIMPPGYKKPVMKEDEEIPAEEPETK